jgi:hypothetical protein
LAVSDIPREGARVSRSFPRFFPPLILLLSARDGLAVAMVRQKWPISQRADFWLSGRCAEFRRTRTSCAAMASRAGWRCTDQPPAGELWRLAAIEDGADHVGREPADAGYHWFR